MLPPDPDEVGRLRADETGRIITEGGLHFKLAHFRWDVDRDRMDSTPGEAPDAWAIINEDGEPRTYRPITDEADDTDEGDT